MNQRFDRKEVKGLPSLVASDKSGNLFEINEYAMLARSGGSFVIPKPGSLMRLPLGSDLHMLPNRYPVGIDRSDGRVVTLKKYRGTSVFAASAFLPPAYTALYLAPYANSKGAPPLPLFAYSPLGFKKNGFVSTAVRIDTDKRQDCDQFNHDEVIRRGEEILSRLRNNRLTTHLIENCAFKYLCPAARNWVMGRWEAPVPVSASCNSMCRGCISYQSPEGGIPSTQERITFAPKIEEIIEYVVPHLEKAKRAIVSFGQGCEGEPLTKARLIEETIRQIRGRTKRGTINLNTNASLPLAVKEICEAGLDSMRVSLNSAQPSYYDAYFRPRGYRLDDVIESMRTAKKLGVWVCVNYFIFPGFTDRDDELAALTDLLSKIPVDMIQMRNLNSDPDRYWEIVNDDQTPHGNIGIRRWMSEVKKIRPSIRFGYFNPYLGNQ